MASVQRWRVGDVEISKIVESQAPMMQPFVVYPTLTEEILARHRGWLAPRTLEASSGLLILAIHSFVIKTKRRTILVDACVGNDKTRIHKSYLHMKSYPYLDNLAAAGFKPAEIDFVLCTHLHADHVGWNTRLIDGRWVPTFPNARYLFTKLEWEHWSNAEKRALYTTDGYYEDSILPVMESGQTELVAMDYAFDDEVWLEPSPGHTPGHVCVRVRSGNADAVMIGDMMHTELQVAEPQLSTCFCVDFEQSARTRRAFLESAADRPTLVMPAHFPSPTAGRVKSAGGSFRFRFDE